MPNSNNINKNVYQNENKSSQSISFIPQWLMTSSDYFPSNDKEGFINRTSKAFVKMLSTIRRSSNYSDFISPELKIIYTLLNIILISLSHNIAFTYFIFGLCVFHMVFMDGNTLSSIIKAALFAALFSSLFLFPSIFFGNYKNIVLILFKVITSVILLSILTHSTNWNKLTHSLRNFYLPSIVIFLLDITVKYIYILGDTCIGMLEALKLKSVGVNHSKEKSASGILGTVYLRSREMSIDTYDAMLCRGFDGEYKAPIIHFQENKTGKIICFDILYVILMFGIIYMFLGPLK